MEHAVFQLQCWIGYARPVARIWKGGVRFWCQLTEGSMWVTQIFQLGVWGCCKPPVGSGQSPGGKRILTTIYWKLAYNQVSSKQTSLGEGTFQVGGRAPVPHLSTPMPEWPQTTNETHTCTEMSLFFPIKIIFTVICFILRNSDCYLNMVVPLE